MGESRLDFAVGYVRLWTTTSVIDLDLITRFAVGGPRTQSSM